MYYKKPIQSEESTPVPVQKIKIEDCIEVGVLDPDLECVGDEVGNIKGEKEDGYNSDKTDDFAEYARKCSPPLTSSERPQICVITNGRPSTVFCRCCLLDIMESDNDNPFKNMQNEAFSFRNQQISFVDGYLDVNNDSIEEFSGLPISEVKICSFCVVQMESAYVFRKLCQEANVVLRRKYLPKESSDQIYSQPVEVETNRDGADSSSRTPVTTNANIEKTSDEHYDDTVVSVVKSTLCVSLRTKSKIRTKAKNSVEDRHLRSSQKYSATDTNDRIVSKQKKDESNCNKADMPSCSDQMENLQDNLDDTVVNNEAGLASLSKRKLVAEANRDISKRSKKVKPSSGRYACAVCLKDYASKCALKTHIDIIHLKKVYPCKHCGREFCSRSNLSHHIRRVHLKIRHKCRKCSKFFTQSHNLWSHTKSEHLHIRYTCDICSTVFTTRNGILVHMQSMHLNKYQSCKICDKKCGQLRELWSHSFTHRGFKPFKCTGCDYTTLCSGNLKKHLKKIHEIKYDKKIHGYNQETYAEVLSFVR